MEKCPYCDKGFKNWVSVRNHTSHCINNTKEYMIHSDYGAIHYNKFNNLRTRKNIKEEYPLLKFSDIIKKFGNKVTLTGNDDIVLNKDFMLQYIIDFVNKHKRIPTSRDSYDWDGPSDFSYKKYFGSWNKAIEAAGFEANYDDGYGTRTKGLDGHLYRSMYEAYFCDNFLYGKYAYIVESKYPEPHNRYYDWYLPDLDLYIELDGGIRPEVIKEKIKVNKELNRKLLVVKSVEIFRFNHEKISRYSKNN